MRTSGVHRHRAARWLFTLLAALFSALAVPTAAAARRATVTEFPLPSAGSQPTGIITGPDGALWFTEQGAAPATGNKIGRISTRGRITEFTLPVPPPPAAFNAPVGIATGPDGALWFTEQGSNNIGRITTTGSVSEFPVPTPFSFPSGITAGPDGALWFTELNGGRIGRITTAGSISEFQIPATCCGPGSSPQAITTGPDGALWFTYSGVENAIGRITTGGTFTLFPLPTGSGEPIAIAAGPDGALWFTIQTGFNDGGAIGRMTTSGAFSEYPVPTPPVGITAGPRRSLWFTASTDPLAPGQVGRISTFGRIGELRLPTPGSPPNLPNAITTGPDGKLWFTESTGNKIGRLSPGLLPSEAFVEGEIHTQPPCSQPGCFEQPRYIFDVTTQPIGENPRGMVTYETGERFGLTSQSGPVTCLYTHGNRATVGVDLGPGFGPAPQPARGALVFLEDNGPVSADMFAVENLPAGTAPSTCPANPPAGVILAPAYPGDAAPASGVTITYLR